jgi:acylphosphatase
MKNYKFIVRGRVQGVFYRKNIYENSSKENFSGYVKNLPDGSVEACLSCDENDVNKFIEILKKGSPSSIVKEIHRYSCDETFSGSFKIRYK